MYTILNHHKTRKTQQTTTPNAKHTISMIIVWITIYFHSFDQLIKLLWIFLMLIASNEHDASSLWRIPAKLLFVYNTSLKPGSIFWCENVWCGFKSRHLIVILVVALSLFKNFVDRLSFNWRILEVWVQNATKMMLLNVTDINTGGVNCVCFSKHHVWMVAYILHIVVFLSKYNCNTIESNLIRIFQQKQEFKNKTTWLNLRHIF